MARQRMVKPDFFASESLGRCSVAARLAFVGLLVNADDYGNLKYQVSRLRRAIMPYDGMSDESFAALLEELEGVGCIFGYESGGQRCVCIPNFGVYQTVNRPSKTAVPAPHQGVGNAGKIASWKHADYFAHAVENPVDNDTLSECSVSTHAKEGKKGRRESIPRLSPPSQVEGEDGAVDNLPPLLLRIKEAVL